MVNNNVHKKTKGRCLCGQVQFEIHGVRDGRWGRTTLTI
jgi:hypothetical protein